MKKLISLVSSLIALVASKKNLIATLKAEIGRLQGVVDSSKANDAERDAKQAELDSLEADAVNKSNDIAALLNDEPALPSVDPATFNVTSGPTASAGDLAFREQQGETAGNVTSVPPVVSAPAASESADQNQSDVQTAEDLANENDKAGLLEIAKTEGVEVDEDADEQTIAQAIVDERAEKANGPQA